MAGLADDALWERIPLLAALERASTCDLVEHFAELERRGLHKDRGFRSLFEYCVHQLACTEAEAYKRMRAARAVQMHDPIMDMMRSGRLGLEAVAMIHPFLDKPGGLALLDAACGLKTWELQNLLASHRPESRSHDVIRVGSVPVAVPAEPEPPASLPLSEDRTSATRPVDPPSVPLPAPPAVSPPSRSKKIIRFAFTADESFHLLFLRARALVRHSCPDGRLEGVLRLALKALVAKKDPLFRMPKA